MTDEAPDSPSGVLVYQKSIKEGADTMPYIKQEEIQPIMAHDYIVSHWEKYNLTDSREDFIALVNVLQACGESIESLHEAFINGDYEYCDIYHGEAWDDEREIVNALFEYSTFYTEAEFINYMIERQADYDSMEEYTEAIRDETTDDSDGNRHAYRLCRSQVESKTGKSVLMGH